MEYYVKIISKSILVLIVKLSRLFYICFRLMVVGVGDKQVVSYMGHGLLVSVCTFVWFGIVKLNVCNMLCVEL